MGKIYGYARVSTKNQRLDRQIKNIEDYCKDKKIERIYREKYTGTKMGRPQFKIGRASCRERVSSPV